MVSSISIQLNNFWNFPTIWAFAKFFKKPEIQHTEDKIVLIAQKNPKHFSKLYDIYHHKIFSYIYRRTKDFDIAADLTSETFVKAFSNIHKYQFQGFGFSSWLYKIATNELNLFFRTHETHTRHVAVYSKTIDQFTEIDESFDADIKSVLLQKALVQLNQEEIQLLEWRFYETLSFKEIGYLLDISEDNAKVRTYRLIDKIKKLIYQK